MNFSSIYIPIYLSIYSRYGLYIYIYGRKIIPWSVRSKSSWINFHIDKYLFTNTICTILYNYLSTQGMVRISINLSLYSRYGPYIYLSISLLQVWSVYLSISLYSRNGPYIYLSISLLQVWSVVRTVSCGRPGSSVRATLTGLLADQE